jgi:hypothetical protein
MIAKQVLPDDRPGRGTVDVEALDAESRHDHRDIVGDGLERVGARVDPFRAQSLAACLVALANEWQRRSTREVLAQPSKSAVHDLVTEQGGLREGQAAILDENHVTLGSQRRADRGGDDRADAANCRGPRARW